MEESGELGLECRVVARFQIGLFQILYGRHEDFGDEAAAVRAEVAARVGLRSHARSASLAAWRNSVIFL